MWAFLPCPRVVILLSLVVCLRFAPYPRRVSFAALSLIRAWNISRSFVYTPYLVRISCRLSLCPLSARGRYRALSLFALLLFAKKPLTYIVCRYWRIYVLTVIAVVTTVYAAPNNQFHATKNRRFNSSVCSVNRFGHEVFISNYRNLLFRRRKVRVVRPRRRRL